jgi:hypothetical protein
MKLRRIFATAFLWAIALALPVAAMSTYTGFTTRATGYIVQAADWNNEFGNFINHYNSNVVAAFNLLNAKGNLLTYTGGALTALTNAGAADDGKILQLSSGDTPGIKWAAVANTTALTTKGDLLGYASNLARIPVGTDGQYLTADSGNANGVSWQTPAALPTGIIAMWSGSIATIPVGWHLCDGTTGTPNLQGLFVVGAGNVSPAATGGMGLVTPGGPSGDTSGGTGLGPSHSHTVSSTSTVITGGSSSSISVVTGVTGTNAKTITPRYYALAYIMKL